MIETPASTLLIEEFSKYVDFFSIGTNDLTQYIMAADRGNPNLVKYQDPLHPAVLRTLENVISTANKNNIEVSVCGEMSSDSISASALYALGLRVFSMSPSSAPFVFQQLNKIKDMDLNKIKDNILALENSTEVREELKKLNL
jgi:phosphoenolpyruvate-protein kinase (PTS system EI component)